MSEDPLPDCDPLPQRLNKANTVISASTVAVIALIDDTCLAVPSAVSGLDSASVWLDRNFWDAETAAFYRAERIGDHPMLICGGIYAPTMELAFLIRKPAS